MKLFFCLVFVSALILAVHSQNETETNHENLPSDRSEEDDTKSKSPETPVVVKESDGKSTLASAKETVSVVTAAVTVVTVATTTNPVVKIGDVGLVEQNKIVGANNYGMN